MSGMSSGSGRREDAAANNRDDVTEDSIVEGCFRVGFEAEYTVECEFDPGKGTTFAEITQALQDALGYTGLVITDVVEYEEIP